MCKLRSSGQRNALHCLALARYWSCEAGLPLTKFPLLRSCCLSIPSFLAATSFLAYVWYQFVKLPSAGFPLIVIGRRSITSTHVAINIASILDARLNFVWRLLLFSCPCRYYVLRCLRYFEDCHSDPWKSQVWYWAFLVFFIYFFFYKSA